MAGEDIRSAIEEQTSKVASANQALQSAERTVSQARTLEAATEAHQRADNALLAVERAEAELLRLQQLGLAPL